MSAKEGKRTLLRTRLSSASLMLLFGCLRAINFQAPETWFSLGSLFSALAALSVLEASEMLSQSKLSQLTSSRRGTRRNTSCKCLEYSSSSR